MEFTQQQADKLASRATDATLALPAVGETSAKDWRPFIVALLKLAITILPTFIPLLTEEETE